MMKICAFFLAMCFTLGTSPLLSQNGSSADKADSSLLQKTSFAGLKFRTLGPALTSGRIADFAVHPDDPKIYYVAVASGGVWKTVNAGTTFEPLFDKQGSYSIGCITMDPNNPNVIWVGTGENNNQRSVAYGDGIYKSSDGGKTWKNMGLKESEHIGSIVVHPDNSDVVYVAAIGPLWSAGGDRGVYKTSDGGKTWECIFSIDENTGANEVHMDPRYPDILYASMHQRRRHVFTYVGGGPQSGLYKSADGGASWDKIHDGLPKVDLGRIGLTISPVDPDVVYAIVEAARDEGGFYRSDDRGERWKKMGKYSTSGNYYQEIIADPVNIDKVFAMDTWMKVTTDGGKSFENVGEVTKHVDNHCIWIDPADTDHFLVGCDGGIYETWDHARTWHFKANLPVTQFYKVSVDNSEPFYHIYGGTQDNFSMGGPSRMVSGNGIANEDWFITHGGDGFESQADHFNPDIVYAQSQYGVLARYDRKSGEEVGIQPQPRAGEDSYRWNWDAPLIASPHSPGRVYFAANKVFRSDDYGQSWVVISDDLTREINRNTLEVMGRVWEFDAVMKNSSTSPYGTIVALAESTLNPELLFAGTDDGLIQRTTDGGANWTKIEGIPGVPDRTYVNALYTSMHDENVVYACFNHHKYGDFKPYVYKSTDRGATWKNISANLPERGSAYAIIEDHLAPELLFVGTEFGVFFSSNGGNDWKQLKSGVPTIAVRDIDIQQRENDLVLGTFGRGFYVLDDYSVLRGMDDELLQNGAHLFPVRDALTFEYSYPLGLPGKSFQGDSYWQGDNLGAVATFTYYLKEDVMTLEEKREEAYKQARKNDQAIGYPSYNELDAENAEEKPMLWFTIRDADGAIVRKLSADPGKGIRRIEWDLRTPSKNPITLTGPGFYNPFAGKEEGTLVPPGQYSVTMSLRQAGRDSVLSEPRTFTIRALENAVLAAANRDALADFKDEVNEFSRVVKSSQRAINAVQDEMKHVREAISRIDIPNPEILDDVAEIENELRRMEKQLNGDGVAATLDMDMPPSIGQRIGFIMYEQKYSTSEPTETHKTSLAIAEAEFQPLLAELQDLIKVDLAALRERLQQAGAPYTPGVVPEITGSGH